MKRLLGTMIGVGALLFFANLAQAQVTSIPPLLQGEKSYHHWTVAGVVNSGGIGTVVTCTNVNLVPVWIGVQVFDATGPAVNDPSATSVSVGPGGTVAFGTASAAGFFFDSNLGIGGLPRGAARVLATARAGIICNAILADFIGLPAGSMSSLIIAKKNVQKGQ